MKNTQPTQNLQEKLCNCRKKSECPLGGQCLKKEIVYQATVNSEGGETETYVGLTANTFKKRHSGHTFNFKHEDSKGTTLSAYIWKLKNQNKNYEISWKILQHTKPFTRKTSWGHIANTRNQDNFSRKQDLRIKLRL